MAEGLVIDASAVVDLVLQRPNAEAIRARLGRTKVVEAPGHLDAETLSAIGRINRSGHLPDHLAEAALDRLAVVPIRRHPVAPLIGDAWALRHDLRLVDALYVALAERLGLPLLTTDRRLAAAWSGAELVG